MSGSSRPAINRNNVVRIVENITVLEDERESESIIEISEDEETKIMEDSELIDRRKKQSSASIILLGEIIESKDKSGNTILNGELQNIGTERGDLVRIDFILRKNFQGDIEILTTYAVGSSHVFKDTGIISNSSIKPGAIGKFKLIIPNSMGNFIGYTYELDWDYSEIKFSLVDNAKTKKTKKILLSYLKAATHCLINNECGIYDN